MNVKQRCRQEKKEYVAELVVILVRNLDRLNAYAGGLRIITRLAQLVVSLDQK
jgi:hypothetical protein